MTAIAARILAEVESVLRDRCSPKARDYLVCCLPHLVEAVDILCPLVSFQTQACLKQAYGPLGVGDGSFALVAATPDRVAVLDFEDFEDLEDLEDVEAESFTPYDFAEAVADAVERTRHDPVEPIATILSGVSALLGADGRAELRKQHARIREFGLTPLCIVLVSKVEKTTFIVYSAELPARLEDQMTLIEAAHATRQ